MFESPLFAFIFLLGSGLLTGISTSLLNLGKSTSETIAAEQKGLAKLFFKKEEIPHLCPLIHEEYFSHLLRSFRSILC